MSWALPPLSLGEFAPPLCAATRTNPNFYFNTVAGRYVVLAFLPDDARRAAALAAFDAQAALFDGLRVAAFFVADGADAVSPPPDHIPGMRWFLDPERAIRRLCGLDGMAAEWLLFDPSLRLLAREPIAAADAFFARIRSLPPLAEYAGAPLVAPVLIVPRVFEPALCRRLIDYYEGRGGEASGVMRDIGGKTVGVLDSMKNRRDVLITEPDFQAEVRKRLGANLAPLIRRALQFNPTRLERYLVACYDADEGGYFRAHRDNETVGTAHRRFAVSINLNAEEFEGGDLRFPEFGPRTYRPPTGGAVVFCCSLQHEATPVTRGRRYAFLPFLYDEEGQRIRERNQAFIDNSAADAARTA